MENSVVGLTSKVKLSEDIFSELKDKLHNISKKKKIEKGLNINIKCKRSGPER